MVRNFPVIDERLQPLYLLEDTNLRVRRNKILVALLLMQVQPETVQIAAMEHSHHSGQPLGPR